MEKIIQKGFLDYYIYNISYIFDEIPTDQYTWVEIVQYCICTYEYSTGIQYTVYIIYWVIQFDLIQID